MSSKQRLEKFRSFITNPPKFYDNEWNPRYPNCEGAYCDNCRDAVTQHFGQPPKMDLCIHCFVLVNKWAAEEDYDKWHEENMRPQWNQIARVNWSEANLSDPPTFFVRFVDGTTCNATREEINAELKRQEEWDYVKNPIVIKPFSATNTSTNAVEEVKNLMYHQSLRNRDLGDDEDF